MQRLEVGTRVPCRATGGTILYTKTGLIHTGGRAYGGEAESDQDEDYVPEVQVKRGRGRPRKNK